MSKDGGGGVHFPGLLAVTFCRHPWRLSWLSSCPLLSLGENCKDRYMYLLSSHPLCPVSSKTGGSRKWRWRRKHNFPWSAQMDNCVSVISWRPTVHFSRSQTLRHSKKESASYTSWTYWTADPSPASVQLWLRFKYEVMKASSWKLAWALFGENSKSKNNESSLKKTGCKQIVNILFCRESDLETGVKHPMHTQCDLLREAKRDFCLVIFFKFW